jgi:hypothetical protein
MRGGIITAPKIISSKKNKKGSVNRTNAGVVTIICKGGEKK